MAKPVAQICLAANAAHDMERRVSAHAIFSVVEVDSFPFSFQAPIYAIVELFNIEPGTPHKVEIVGEEGIEVESAETILNPPRPFGIAVVPVVQCTILREGCLKLGVSLDGERIKGTARLIAFERAPETEEGG